MTPGSSPWSRGEDKHDQIILYDKNLRKKLWLLDKEERKEEWREDKKKKEEDDDADDSC